MKILSVDETIKKIKDYWGSNFFCPYFVIADGAEECAAIKKFFANILATLYVSDFCGGDFPLDTDLFVEKLKNLEKDTMCFGLGEYVYFTGQENILRIVQDKNFNRKIIFICRGVANFLERLADEDPKFQANRICRVTGKSDFSVVKYSPKLNFKPDAGNFTELLNLLEHGQYKTITVKSELPLLNVKEINSFYDAIKIRDPHFPASPNALTETQWQEYFFDDKCAGYSPEHWRTFATGFKNKFSDAYLKYVFSISKTYEDYRKNLLFALLDVTDEKLFAEFYPLRKSAIKNISATYLAEFIGHVKKFSEENVIKFLTDNTAAERRTMIESVQGVKEIPEVLLQNYPAIKNYLADYDLGDDEITKYFQCYKKIKLCNVDDEDFRQLVEQFAITRPYNKIYTRRALLDKFNKNSKLYWIDALGVEFLSFIRYTAVSFGLDFKVGIGRSNLPTLTALNKDFYDDWHGDKFEKNQKLDELKHSPEKFDKNGKCSAPIYICDELKIIYDAIEEIKIWLENHRGEKVLLTSDHGASRPAVMFGREIKYKMRTAGEHSGRCCPINNIDEKPDCTIEENGYWCLANYDRFSGGRLASVEVHGGATLEEILVPIIEFSLKKYS